MQLLFKRLVTRLWFSTFESFSSGTCYKYWSSIMVEEGSVLLVDPFHGGSHKQLSDLLSDRVKGSVMVTMTAKKWMWRSRTSALWLSQNIPYSEHYKILFSSGVLNLAELTALRPDLSKLKKILYFHENQLVYPVRKQKDRDFQHGYNQILSCLVADVVIFNSIYNKKSFLSSVNTFLKLMPDYRPKDLIQQIEPKCRVIYFPLILPAARVPVYTGTDSEVKGDNSVISLNETAGKVAKRFKSSSLCFRDDGDKPDVYISADNLSKNSVESFTSKESVAENKKEDIISEEDNVSQCKDVAESSIASSVNTRLGVQNESPLHIVWAHRWEHDKDPETFFKVLFQLQEAGCMFKLSVMGEQYTEQPEIFEIAKDRLELYICHWGYQERKEEYYKVLQLADVAVSTALHEFFGVAMMEATYFGCYPLCPNRLVYPEIFPKCYLYNTPTQLFKKLKSFCVRPWEPRNHELQVPVEKFLWENCYKHFEELFTDDETEHLKKLL